jgi:hypothetical protein
LADVTGWWSEQEVLRRADLPGGERWQLTGQQSNPNPQ